MKPTEIFFNEYGNLRSGWRFASFLGGMLLFGAVFGALIGAVYYSVPAEFVANRAIGFAGSILIILIPAVVVGWLCGKFLERLPFRALGCSLTAGWAKDLIFGLTLGAATIGLAALIPIVFGATTFQLNQNADQTAIIRTLAVSFLIFTLAAAAEELLFRGYILQTFLRARLVVFSVVLTSVLFAYTHTQNPSASYLSFVNTALAGFWFAVAFLKTRTLWFPFGLHLAWNWVLGAILGISVSGINEITPDPLLKPVYTGSTLMTGGDYGIEGSIACTLALLISTALIWFLPILKPTAEMLALTSEEKPKQSAIAA